MKRTVHLCICSIMAVLFCMSIILTNPSFSKAESANSHAGANAPESDRVEARINAIHSNLKITEAQEDQWKQLAQVMRENAKTMGALIQARKEKGNTLNAVEDLKSYSEIADAHAAGLKKFVSTFEPLYASMSDEQKKIADKVFTRHAHKRFKKK